MLNASWKRLYQNIGDRRNTQNIDCSIGKRNEMRKEYYLWKRKYRKQSIANGNKMLRFKVFVIGSKYQFENVFSNLKNV